MTAESSLLVPCINLTAWVLGEAAREAEVHGFGWKATDQPPEGYCGIVRAFEHCSLTSARFPVASCASGTSIYVNPEANYALRFLHDMTHIKLRMPFDLESEMYVAVDHLNRLRQAGYQAGSPEWHLLHADTVGQLLASEILGRFPYDQRLFDFDCVAYGFTEAVRLEGRREPPS